MTTLVNFVNSLPSDLSACAQLPDNQITSDDLLAHFIDGMVDIGADKDEPPRKKRRTCPSAQRKLYSMPLEPVKVNGLCAGMSELADRSGDEVGYDYAQWRHAPVRYNLTDAAQELDILDWFVKAPDSKGVQMVARIATSGDNPWCTNHTFMETHGLAPEPRRAEDGILLRDQPRATTLMTNMLVFNHPREPRVRPSRSQCIDWRMKKTVPGGIKSRKNRHLRVNPVHIRLYKSWMNRPLI